MSTLISKSLLFISLLLLSDSVSSQPKIIPLTEVSPGSNIYFGAVITPSDITITFQGPSDRWLACGFGSSMSNSDALIYSDGKPGAMHSLGIFDYNMTSQGATGVNKDIVDDWDLISMVTSGGTRTFEAKRFLVTGDSEDHEFNYSDDSFNIIWATGSNSTYTLGYHGSAFRGNTTFTWVFPDTIPPVISGFLFPSDNSTGATLATDMTITFDEDIMFGTGYIKLHELNSGSLIEQYDVATSTNLSISGPALTLLPTNLLASFTEYYITVDSNAIQDFSLNSYSGFIDSTTWNFETLDNSNDSTPPLISGAFIPIDNAVNVTLNSNFTISFDEDIAFGTGNITLKNYLTGAIIESFDVTTALNLSLSMNTIFINPTNFLSIDGQYSITIDPTAITDLIGNQFAGISDSTTWNFAVYTNSLNELESFFDISFETANQLIITTDLTEQYLIKLVSLSGQILKSLPNLASRTSIDLSSLPRGLIVLQLVSEHGTLSKKIVLR